MPSGQKLRAHVGNFAASLLINNTSQQQLHITYTGISLFEACRRCHESRGFSRRALRKIFLARCFRRDGRMMASEDRPQVRSAASIAASIGTTSHFAVRSAERECPRAGAQSLFLTRGLVAVLIGLSPPYFDGRF